jgi:predicted DNA-binding WGR domain protein
MFFFGYGDIVRWGRRGQRGAEAIHLFHMRATPYSGGNGFRAMAESAAKSCPAQVEHGLGGADHTAVRQ